MLGLSFAEIGDTTPIELDHLIDYYRVDQDKENLRYGTICSTIAETHRNPEARSEPFTAWDFFHRLTDEVTEQSEDDPDDPTIEKNNATMLDAFWLDVKIRNKITKRKVT